MADKHNPDPKGKDPGLTSVDYVPDNLVMPVDHIEPLEGRINQQDSKDVSTSAIFARSSNTRSDFWSARVLEIDKKIQTQLGNLNPGIALEGVNTGLVDGVNIDDPFDPTGGTASGGRAGIAGVDIQTKMLIRTGRALEVQGLAFFGIKQELLHKLNVYEHSRDWDPLYFVNRIIPGLHKTRPVSTSLSSLQGFLSSGGGRHEERVSDDVNRPRGESLLATESLLNDTPSLKSRSQNEYEVPFVKKENDIMLAGAHQSKNRSGPRLVGAASQDESLVPRDAALNPQTYAGGYSGIPLVELAMEMRNQYTSDVKWKDNPFINLHEIIDTIFDGDIRPGFDAKVLSTPSGLPQGSVDYNISIGLDSPGVRRKKFDIKSLFNNDDVKLGKVPIASLTPSKRNMTRTEDHELAKSSFAHGVLPMSFPKERLDGSYITSDGDPTKIISDNAAYVPLSFTDMRPLQGNTAGRFRTVYFRPIITAFSEEHTPEWSSDAYWGRVDPVMIYSHTKRTINFTFEMHAFAPEDLKVIYNKLHWLTSMAYPEYDSESIMKSGPVCRLRIGDIIKSGPQGLPGVIESLTYDYTDQIWELKKDHKVPRSVVVNCSYTVLHDVIMGRDSAGNFGGIGNIDPSTGQFTTPDILGESISVGDTTVGDIADASKHRAFGTERLKQED